MDIRKDVYVGSLDEERSRGGNLLVNVDGCSRTETSATGWDFGRTTQDERGEWPYRSLAAHGTFTRQRRHFIRR